MKKEQTEIYLQYKEQRPFHGDFKRMLSHAWWLAYKSGTCQYVKKLYKDGWCIVNDKEAGVFEVSPAGFVYYWDDHGE